MTTDEEIRIDREPADSPAAVALVIELTEHLTSRYSPESCHGFSVEQLVRGGVAFFVARVDGVPAGCGGILLVDDATGRFGEVKRMYVRPVFRGRGVGRRILERLERHAREHGHGVLRLETGIHQAEALSLYESYGFVRIPPYPPYFDDPVSRCYELVLTP